MITYDNTPEIREMYNWCTSIQDNEWNYTINRTDDQRNKCKLKDGYQSNRYKGKEVFITNYDLSSVSGISYLKINEEVNKKH